MSMKVEKSTVEQVKQRFEFNKKKKEEEKKQYGEVYNIILYITQLRCNTYTNIIITSVISIVLCLKK